MPFHAIEYFQSLSFRRDMSVVHELMAGGIAAD